MIFPIIFSFVLQWIGCSVEQTAPAHAATLTSVDLALNWKPEPEFGGFFEAARTGGSYESAHLQVKIIPGGAGQPVAQMVAAKKVMFGISSADEVILAREKGAKIVALFAVYQKDPHAFMVNPKRKIKSLKELFQSEGVIALQKGLPQTEWIKLKFAPIRATLVPYPGGVTQYLESAKSGQNYAQQCFVFSEPVNAKLLGQEAQVLSVAESGFNPYLTVVVAHEDTLREQSAMVKAFVKATQNGWVGYMKNPDITNALMNKLNPSMSLDAFRESSRLQASYIENSVSKKQGLGVMTLDRWKQTYQVLIELKLAKPGMDSSQFFLWH